MESRDVKWDAIRQKEREILNLEEQILSGKEKVREKDTRIRGTFCKIGKDHERRS